MNINSERGCPKVYFETASFLMNINSERGCPKVYFETASFFNLNTHEKHFG